MTKLGILALFFRFLLVSLWARGWRGDPTSVFPLGMPLKRFIALGAIRAYPGWGSGSLVALLSS